MSSNVKGAVVTVQSSAPMGCGVTAAPPTRVAVHTNVQRLVEQPIIQRHLQNTVETNYIEIPHLVRNEKEVRPTIENNPCASQCNAAPQACGGAPQACGSNAYANNVAYASVDVYGVPSSSMYY